MSDLMQTVHFDHHGGPEVLRLVQAPRPIPAHGQVRIKVVAAGVNRADLAQREGSYAPPANASPVLGLEVSGTVDAVGAGVDASWLGRKVCSLTAGGGYAQWVCVPALLCMPLPPGLDWLQAAAFPEAAMTVWSNVFQLARLCPGESLLVHGGTSGVGSFAVALANAWRHPVFGTAGSAYKCEVLRNWGAEAIDYRQQDFVECVRQSTQGRGVDVVLDMVGGDYLARNVECLAVGGRVVQIAFMRGSQARIDLMALMRKRAVITGSLLRPRSDSEKARMVSELQSRVFPLLASGRLAPVVIDSVYPMSRAHEAHRRMAGSQHIGKLVLVWD